MASTVTGAISLSASMSETGTNAFSGGPNWGGQIDFSASLRDGTTAGRFDLAYMAERTVNASTNDDIDLAGVLTTPLGESVASAEIVGIIIVNKPKDPSAAANLSSLTIGAGSNPVAAFTNAGRTITPGGFFAEFSPAATGLAAIAAGTGDILRVANGSGGQAKYQIAIFARSA
jgi:hypothetical protein